MPIHVEQDDRIRLTGSVLLLTDLINENSSWKPPAVKVASLEHLAPYRDHPCARAARELDPLSSMGSAFYCYAVLLEGREGKFACKRQPGPSDRYEVELQEYRRRFDSLRFSDLLWDFYRDTGLARFWEMAASHWEETVADCRALLAQEDPGPFLDIFYGLAAENLVVVPNPLNPTSFGYGPRDGRTAFCIAGPPNVSMTSMEPVRYSMFGRDFQSFLFHEFSHTLLDMAKAAIGPEVERRLYDAFRGMPFNGKFARLYDTPDARLRFDEILIRAATALYEREMGRESSASEYLSRQKDEYGLGWVEALFEALQGYLVQRRTGRYGSLAEYLPVLADSFRPGLPS